MPCLSGFELCSCWVPLFIWRTRNRKINCLAYMLGSCMSVSILSNDVFFAFGTGNAMAIGPLTFLWSWIRHV